MIPFLGDPGKKRAINLGGSTAASHASIIDQAKSRRVQRERVRRQEESALRIQCWYRSRTVAYSTRVRLQSEFDTEMSYLDAARYLVLFGSKDKPRLQVWAQRMNDAPEDSIRNLFAGPDGRSWFTLLRQLSVVLIISLSQSPQAPSAVIFSKLLVTLLTPSTYPPPDGRTTCENLMHYLCTHSYFGYLRTAIEAIPVEQKSDPGLPFFVSLATAPLHISQSDSSAFGERFSDLLSHILTIPQLPNRLPLTSVSHLSARIPFLKLDTIDVNRIFSLSLTSKTHLLANMSTFALPRYSKLPTASLDMYLTVTSHLLSDIPPMSIEPESVIDIQDEADESDEEVAVAVIVDDFEALPALTIDSRTSARLKALGSSTHLHPLMAASSRQQSSRRAFFHFALVLSELWASKRSAIWRDIATTGGPGMIREVYRNWVRPSPLGKSETTFSVTDGVAPEDICSILFLIELYTSVLLTMGDDEFFAPTYQQPRNPLPLDEVASFAKQVLGIAFPLYWQRDPQNSTKPCMAGLRITWDGFRDKCSKCLQALHARDSRRSFTVPGHWLWTEHLDMHSFVTAAVAEENELDRRLTKRQIALLSPRLGVLSNLPFSIPFDVRVAIFRSFIKNDRQRAHPRSTFHFDRRSTFEIRRDKLAQDGFDHLQDVDLKKQFQITFIDQFGNPEMGIDGGGVFKEFLTSLVKEVFDSDRGLWLENLQHELFPNPHSYAIEAHSLNWYRFIGRILGKALYEGILVDVTFAGFFLAKLLGKQSYLDDLASMDNELYHGLTHLKKDPNPENLSLDFTITSLEFGVPRTIELIHNGASIPITRYNRLQYIHLVSHYHLNRKIKLQSEAFFDGLAELIDPKWLRMFNQQEMQLLISGANAPIDIDDLRDNTQYGGVYDDQEDTIKVFWKVIKSFDQEQRTAFLRFVTSCGRPPLLGFKELRPMFSVRDSGNDQSRLPTASTCVNLLKLPRYQSESILREKMLQAIFSGAGFDLS